jgi:3-deoxy-D-manno-octulosonate 8-phosphate phosphatase (KDO 8-P phosphatase)
VNDKAIDKARRVKLLVLDVDGVLTDGRMLYADASREGVFFNVHDGTGIKYLHRSGIQTAIISGRDIEAVRTRAADLGIQIVLQGAKVKAEAYEQLIAQTGLQDSEIAYVGDDLPDIPVMRRVGLAVAVPNAVPEVVERADIVTTARGGDGAVREIAEFILKAQGKWEAILARYIR